MKAPIKSLGFWPPLLLLQGERIEVRGSKTARELKLQTLTLGKGEGTKPPHVSKRSQT